MRRETGRHTLDIIIRKEDIERIPIIYSDLFKPESGNRKHIRRVFVEVDAGIGKITLTTGGSDLKILKNTS